MTDRVPRPPLAARDVRRAVAFVLAGVVALVLKSRYQGPFAEYVHNWAGNVGVSFALYFLANIAVARVGLGRLSAAAAALLAVEAFEVMDGFGVMANVYDPLDLAANAVGVGIALAADVATSRPGAARESW